MAPRILIIEDEPAIADTIVFALTSEGFEPSWYPTGAQGRAALTQHGADLLIVDIGLPDMNGRDLCREVRASTGTPCIILTARSSETDRVLGLEMGADDYVTKPFSPRELVARVRAVLRRCTQAVAPSPAPGATGTQPVATVGPFAIDSLSKTISYNGTPLALPRYEYLILELLLSAPGRVYSRRQIMETVWDEPDVSLERTVDTHIKTIRRKLDEVTPGVNPVETSRGFGYFVSLPDPPRHGAP